VVVLTVAVLDTLPLVVTFSTTVITAELPAASVPMVQVGMPTKVDSLLNDVDGDGVADPGDTLRYTVTVTNGTGTNCTNVVFTDTVDANTTLVPGSVKVLPLAIDDS
jgi:uncharacterized repeat protein (TIGR01451 family)